MLPAAAVHLAAGNSFHATSLRLFPKNTDLITSLRFIFGQTPMLIPRINFLGSHTGVHLQVTSNVLCRFGRGHV
jgi:hypothetical protein